MRAALCALDTAVGKHTERGIELCRAVGQHLGRAAHGEDRLAELRNAGVCLRGSRRHLIAERGQVFPGSLDPECRHGIGRKVGGVGKVQPARRRKVQHCGQRPGGRLSVIPGKRQVVERRGRLGGGEHGGFPGSGGRITQERIAVHAVLDGVLRNPHGRDDLRHAPLEILAHGDRIGPQR